MAEEFLDLPDQLFTCRRLIIAGGLSFHPRPRQLDVTLIVVCKIKGRVDAIVNLFKAKIKKPDVDGYGCTAEVEIHVVAQHLLFTLHFVTSIRYSRHETFPVLYEPTN